MNLVANVTTVSSSDTLVWNENPFSSRSLHMDRMLSRILLTSVIEYGGTVDAAIFFLGLSSFFRRGGSRTDPLQPLSQSATYLLPLYPGRSYLGESLHCFLRSQSDFLRRDRARDQTSSVQTMLAMHQAGGSGFGLPNKIYGFANFPERNASRWPSLQKESFVENPFWYGVGRCFRTSQIQHPCGTGGYGLGLLCRHEAVSGKVPHLKLHDRISPF